MRFPDKDRLTLQVLLTFPFNDLTGQMDSRFELIDNPDNNLQVRFVWNKVRYVINLTGELFRDAGGYGYEVGPAVIELQSRINLAVWTNEDKEKRRAWLLTRQL